MVLTAGDGPGGQDSRSRQNRHLQPVDSSLASTEVRVTFHPVCTPRTREMMHASRFGCICAQVCQPAEGCQGYDGELGLCVCTQPPGRSPCDGSCRRSPTGEVKLQCRPGGGADLVHNNWVRRGQKGISSVH